MVYRLGGLGRDLRRRQVDLNRCQRPGWWHRPFSALELEGRPDRERIYATIEAAAVQLVTAAIDAVIAEES
jgi:hypothetical protein